MESNLPTHTKPCSLLDRNSRSTHLSGFFPPPSFSFTSASRPLPDSPILPDLVELQTTVLSCLPISTQSFESTGCDQTDKFNSFFSQHLADKELIISDLPSRTLLVRNFSAHAEGELILLFSFIGEIHSIYSECSFGASYLKISYYDIRHSTLAFITFQGSIYIDQRLDIHYASNSSFVSH